MKNKITETVNVERERVVSITCDICKKTHKGCDYSSGYHISETKVYCKSGVSYPECGWGDYYEIDICPSCFEDKLIPWIESFGSKIEEKEWRE